MVDRQYKVGQVLFIIPAEKALVVPVCVLEKRTSETTEGVAMTYIVKSPKPDAPAYDLASVKGAVYTSIEEVRNTMFQNARRAIEDMITRAEQAALKAFGHPTTAQQQIQSQQAQHVQRVQQAQVKVPSSDPFDSDPLGDMSVKHTSLVPLVQNVSSQHDNIVEVPQSDGTLKKVRLIQ